MTWAWLVLCAWWGLGGALAAAMVWASVRNIAEAEEIMRRYRR